MIKVNLTNWTVSHFEQDSMFIKVFANTNTARHNYTDTYQLLPSVSQGTRHTYLCRKSWKSAGRLVGTVTGYSFTSLP